MLTLKKESIKKLQKMNKLEKFVLGSFPGHIIMSMIAMIMAIYGIEAAPYIAIMGAPLGGLVAVLLTLKKKEAQ